MNLKWTVDLNTRAESIKLLEENIREQFSYLGFGKVFLRMTYRVVI